MKKWWAILGLSIGIMVTLAIKLIVPSDGLLAINSLEDATYAFIALFVIGAIIGFIIDLIVSRINKAKQNENS